MNSRPGDQNLRPGWGKSYWDVIWKQGRCGGTHLECKLLGKQIQDGGPSSDLAKEQDPT
jgi:hypothetical protein